MSEILLYIPGLIQTADGKTVLKLPIAKPKLLKKAFGGFACQTLCGLRLHRPHLTCLKCRIRRVYYKKMPNMIEVELVMLLINKRRRFAKAKGLLLAKLLAICETLAN